MPYVSATNNTSYSRLELDGKKSLAPISTCKERFKP
jgi:hypothetical protein